MKNKLILALFVCLWSLNTIDAQYQELHSSASGFYLDKDIKTHWKNAAHLFNHDQDLLSRYIKFRRSKKIANVLGYISIPFAIAGVSIFLASEEYYGQAVGLVFLGLGAPTGITGIIVAAIASGRKSKLIYLYNKQGLSYQKLKQPPGSELRIHINGLSMGLSFSF